MRRIFFTLLLIAGLFTASHARTLTAVANGNWETSSTWSPASVPTNNDIVLIPGGKTVSIISNINEKTSFMELRIAGTLDFVGGGAKLWLNSLSKVYVYATGQITANQNSQVITLGSTTVLTGPGTGVTTVTGPSVATASSAGTASSSSTTGAAGFLPYNPVALPVTFIAFTATRQHNDVLVQWSTAQEADADRFDVELSADGRSWTSYGSVTAAGTSNSTRQYSFTARNVTGSIQVRVKQVDFNGRYTYTAVRTLKAEAGTGVSLSAGPGRVLLNFNASVTGATIRIMSLNGQVLQEQKLATAIGQVLVPVRATGLCVVAVLGENELLATQKVVL